MFKLASCILISFGFILPAYSLKIISLAPSLTVIASDIINSQSKKNAKKITIVGTIHYIGEPVKYKNIPSIGNYANINLEKIIMLKPDIVLALGATSFIQVIERLKDFGIKVVAFKSKNLLDIGATIKAVGNEIGLPESAKHIADNYLLALHKLRLQASKEKIQSKSNKTVFIQLSDTPLFTIGKKSILNEVVSLCGGENIFAKLNVAATEVSKATIINKNPDIIIQLNNNDRNIKLFKQNKVSQWQSWKELKAVKLDNIYDINPNILSQNTPNIIKGIKAMCNIINMPIDK